MAILGNGEKPAHPKSPLRGDRDLSVRRHGVRKSAHAGAQPPDELEITDVNNAYIREGTMSYSFLDGWWTDAGTFESLLRAANLVASERQASESATSAPQ